LWYIEVQATIDEQRRCPVGNGTLCEVVTIVLFTAQAAKQGALPHCSAVARHIGDGHAHGTFHAQRGRSRLLVIHSRK
jgi:hypothetical protein